MQRHNVLLISFFLQLSENGFPLFQRVGIKDNGKRHRLKCLKPFHFDNNL